MNGTSRTKAQLELGLDQMCLLRIADRHATASGTMRESPRANSTRRKVRFTTMERVQSRLNSLFQ
eukprot:235318-Prymnesium_polylepis.2